MFVKTGLGTMRLTNLDNTADITVAQGKLRVDDITSNGGNGAFGSGAITFDGGTFQWAGGDAEVIQAVRPRGRRAGRGGGLPGGHPDARDAARRG